MKNLTKTNNNSNPTELENVIDLIQYNMDCTKDIIYHIDDYLESKLLPKPILDALVAQRNTCAVNVMNFTRVMKQI